MAETGEKRIIDFLVELADDPNRVALAWESFDEALKGSGLTKLQKNVLLSRDFTRLYQAIEAEGGVDERAFFIVIIGLS